jgi:hypothetical protein
MDWGGRDDCVAVDAVEVELISGARALLHLRG